MPHVANATRADYRASILVATLLSIGALSIPSIAAAETACPDTLTVQQRAEAPNGWDVSYAEQAPRLSGVAIFDGPPSNRASLKYNLRNHSAKEVQVRWNLIYSPRSHYLQCSYARTTAHTSIALPAGTRMCEVIYDRNVSNPGAGPAIKRMVCK